MEMQLYGHIIFSVQKKKIMPKVMQNCAKAKYRIIHVTLVA